MMETLKIIWTNLEKWQRIILVAVFQGIIIIIIITVLSSIINGRENHIDIVDKSNQISSIPPAAKDACEDALWQIIKTNVGIVDKNIIKDVRVRDGSYTETVVNDNGMVQAGFIVDIDSIQQTYHVIVSWDKNDANVQEAIVDCPTLDEIKFPDSFCQGTYRNGYDLSLYLPYKSSSEETNTDFLLAPDLYIDGDQNKKYLDIMLSMCDVERFKKEAWDYLNSLPIDFSEYTINYRINEVNVEC